MVMKKKSLKIFGLALLAGVLGLKAQVSESCECTVDTLGYSTYIGTLSPDEEATFQFHPHGTFAVAYGVIGPSTPNVVQSLIDNYPEVTTIVMYACPGSMDDESNIEASQMIHDHGYKMYLPMNGWIASGATDMFMAGSVRVLENTPDAVGVHSWEGGGQVATDFPIGHPYHQFYINYYVEMGLTESQAEDFYYFTINSAPANDIYWMTDQELDDYHVRSCRFSETPVYSVSREGDALMADLAGASYQWIDCSNNEIIDGANDPIYYPDQLGNYSVMVTEMSCGDTSECFNFEPAYIAENMSKSLVLHYDIINDQIDLDVAWTNFQVSIVDMQGRIVQVVNNSKRLFTGYLPDGMYVVLVQNELETYSGKFMK